VSAQIHIRSQRVIDNKAVIAILGSKRTNMPIDNSRGQQCGETEPVGARVHEKAIVGILGMVCFHF